MRKYEKDTGKHFSKPLEESSAYVQTVLNKLAATYEKNRGWMTSDKFSRADCMAVPYIQWAIWTNEYKQVVTIPDSLHDYMKKAR